MHRKLFLGLTAAVITSPAFAGNEQVYEGPAVPVLSSTATTETGTEAEFSLGLPSLMTGLIGGFVPHIYRQAMLAAQGRRAAAVAAKSTLRGQPDLGRGLPNLRDSPTGPPQSPPGELAASPELVNA